MAKQAQQYQPTAADLKTLSDAIVILAQVKRSPRRCSTKVFLEIETAQDTLHKVHDDCWARVHPPRIPASCVVPSAMRRLDRN